MNSQVEDWSPGDVIAAYEDGTIVLDDSLTTWNMTRAIEFFRKHGEWSKHPIVVGDAVDEGSK